MKKINLLALFLLAVCHLSAQEFNKQLAAAKTAYSAKKLDDARFAMQQALQELDITVGKEVLKLLPAKVGDQSTVPVEDNVSGASGWVGVTIHRQYGTGDKQVELDILTNSPLIANINAILSMPFVANASDYKIIKVKNYKAMVQKNGADDKPEYEIQLPLNNSLITLKGPGYTQDQMIQMANTLPVEAIAKMLE